MIHLNQPARYFSPSSSRGRQQVPTFALAVFALFIATPTWAGSQIEAVPVTIACKEAAPPRAASPTEHPADEASINVMEVSTGIDQAPLADHALGHYRGTGGHGIDLDASHQQVAVILWDERGNGGRGTTKTGSAGYGSNQATNVVVFRMK
jgi:hypothetical protein